MVVGDAGKVDAAVRHGGGKRRAETGIDEQEGPEPQGQNGAGLPAQVSEFPEGLHGGNPALGCGGSVEHRPGTEMSRLSR